MCGYDWGEHKKHTHRRKGSTAHITHHTSHSKASIEKGEDGDCMFTEGEQTVWTELASILRHTHGERERATQHTI